MQGLLANPHTKDLGCPTGALSTIRWAFVPVTPADFASFLYIVPYTSAAGAALAVSGTVGPTSSRVWEQVGGLFQMWQRWPLCPGLSPEPARSVSPTFREF